MTVSIVATFESVARRQPDATAIAWRRCTWTYAQLFAASERVRNAVVAFGVERGERVALLVRNSPQYAALYYGILGAGCVSVPLNAQERAPVLARQIQHCTAKLVIAEREHPEYSALVEAATSLGVQVVSISLRGDGESFATFVSEIDPSMAGAASRETQPDDLATIIYTSGTTGRPKGVMLSHGNLAANTSAIIAYLQLTPADRGLCVLPFHFSYGNSVLHTHLSSGATLLIEDNFAFPKVTVQRMKDEAVTGFAGVPSTFALMLNSCDLRTFDLKALRYVTQAGGAMPRPLIQRLREQLGHAQLFIMYGQTEATARLTYLPPEQLDAHFGSVGIPLQGVEIKIVDDHGRDGGPEQRGQICARGANVMQGYWNDAAATAEAIHDGWLHTGDLGYKDAAGFLYIDGRAVDMIKVGAFRVSPQEIEEVIAAIPAVAEVGVTAVADDILGHSIKAVIVPRANTSLDAMAVKAHCRQQLAAYKVPKTVEFATVLPRTSSGKIQRYKLA